MEKQWYGISTYFEPNYGAKAVVRNYGSPCVEYTYREKPIWRNEIVLSPYRYFHNEAIEKAEKTGKTLRLFPYDISFGEASLDYEKGIHEEEAT